MTERRSFLRHAGAGLAASALAAPALAQSASLPTLRWKLASSFPKSLDTLFHAVECVARDVKAATGGKFEIQLFAAGELVPSAAVLDAVKDGTVELGHSASYYYVGKDPTFAFDCAVPFGLNSRQQSAWMWAGGGMPLLREFFRGYNVYNIPCGNTGVQMGGWFRKEIKTVQDMKGLKMRIAGIAGQVMGKLGVVGQQMGPADIYPALEKGTIDAVEWVGPYDDEKLGFNRVAKYYYYPGFWEAGPQLSIYVNLKKWSELPREYQAILEAACANAHVQMQADYDVKNVVALRRLVAAGAQLREFPREVMIAAQKATFELYDEFSAKHATFRKVYTQWRRFRDEQNLWFRVAERAYDGFIYSQAGGAQQTKR
ncbi:MAG: TRAP transporter substrate-binding protein [Candidatus Dactylopiibacterium sp.]|nr:TRAP transporter substrate-binding protein [Candidatus Dactylopiibacterium sp.]